MSLVDEQLQRPSGKRRNPTPSSRPSYAPSSSIQTSDRLRPPRTSYSKEVDIGMSLFSANVGEEIDGRPAGIARWSVDDFIVEEIWPDDSQSLLANGDSCPGAKGGRWCAEVASEGISDSEIMTILSSRCKISAVDRRQMEELKFVQPTDFFAGSRRRILLPTIVKGNPLWDAQQHAFGAHGGVLVVSPKGFVPSSGSDDGSFRPLARRYTVVVRGVESSIQSVVSRLDAVRESGVINYTPHVRHGFHLSRSYSSGLSLLERSYPKFFAKYLQELPEGIPTICREVDVAADTILNPSLSGSSRHCWKSCAEGMKVQIQKTQNLLNLPLTGVYHGHLQIALDTVSRIAALSSSAQLDTALIIRETMSKQTIRDKLRALSDVHFNAQASLRFQLLGNSVRPGDLVLAPNSDRRALDSFHTKEDHLYHLGEEHHYAALTSDSDDSAALKLVRSGRLLRVADNAMARNFTVEDVVLPRLGKRSLGRESQEYLFPSNRCGQSMFDELALKLRMTSLEEMKMSPPFAYRPLVVKPRDLRCALFDDVKDLKWGCDELAAQTFVDTDGIRRFTSPATRQTSRRLSVRPGVRGPAREKFLSIGKRPGMVCVIQFTLPLGSSPATVLREVFKTKTIDPSTLVQMILSKR